MDTASLVVRVQRWDLPESERSAAFDEIGRRYRAALAYLEGIALDLDYYTGHKPLVCAV